MIHCAFCREENAVGAGACGGCGRFPGPLRALLGEVCPECDGFSPPGAALCALCGHRFDPMEATSPAEEEVSIGDLDLVAGPEVAKVHSSVEPSETTAEVEPDREALEGEPIGEESIEEEVLDDHLADAEEEDDAPILPMEALLAETEEPTSPPEGDTLTPTPMGGGMPPGWAAFHSRPGARLETGSRSRVVVLDAGGNPVRGVPLEAESTSVGRGGAPISFPDDPFLAPVHAAFVPHGTFVAVRDQGSANGVFLRLREARVLRPGDLFMVGERVLRYGGASTLVAPAELRHGSPRPGDRLHTVEEVLEGGGVGRVCRRAGPTLSIGRIGCDLTFYADATMAGRHAELSLSAEGAILRDLGSASGTYVRIAPWSEQPLVHGDTLRMGRETLRVELAPA